MTKSKMDPFDIPYPKSKPGPKSKSNRGGARPGAGRPKRKDDGRIYQKVNCGRWNKDDLDGMLDQLTPGQRQAVLILAARRQRMGLDPLGNLK